MLVPPCQGVKVIQDDAELRPLPLIASASPPGDTFPVIPGKTVSPSPPPWNNFHISRCRARFSTLRLICGVVNHALSICIDDKLGSYSGPVA